MDDEDDQILRLRDKVGLLKNISIQIGEETRQQNRFLQRQDSVTDSLMAQLSNNMGMVRGLAKDANHRIVFYLLAFALFVMLVIYFITKSM